MTIFIKRVVAMLAAAAVVLAGWALYRAFPPEPVNCALCGEDSFVIGNAPFLLELSSGKSCELRIYERVPYNLYDLADEQRDGYFSFLHCGKAQGYIDGGHDCHITLPLVSSPIDKTLYCSDCRRLLASIGRDGYALVDAYGTDERRILPVREGASYDLRVYTVNVERDEGTGQLVVHEYGHLEIG